MPWRRGRKGAAVDAVYLPPGRRAYVRATGLSGGDVRAGTRYFISDTGVRYAVHDDDAAHDLGMPEAMIAAPWPVLAKLPAGPELSRANASVAQMFWLLTGRTWVRRSRVHIPPSASTTAKMPPQTAAPANAVFRARWSGGRHGKAQGSAPMSGLAERGERSECRC